MTESETHWQEKSLPELGFRVRYRKIYAVLDFEVDNAGGAETEAFAHGHVKFDGCCNVMFNDCADNVAVHGCGREDMTRIGRLFDALYDLAIEVMPEHRDYLEARQS